MLELKENIPASKTKDRYYYQYIVAFSAALIAFTSAGSFAWTSPALPILLGPDSPIPISEDESSWIVALFFVGLLFTPIPAVWIMDRYGRKTILLLSVIPNILGWILIGVADSIVTLYISRLLSGICYACTYSVIPVYLGEIASDRIRGSISVLLTVMAKFGILYVFSVAPYVPMQTMGWLGLIPAIIFILTFVWLPESPYYLLGKNRPMDALINLRKLRRNDDVHEELDKMSENVRRSKENQGTYRELWQASNRRSLLIVLGLGFVQVACGSQAIISYSNTLFSQFGTNFLAPNEMSILFSVIQLFAAILASALIDFVGRRPLLFTAAFGTSICTTIIGVYFLLMRLGVNVTDSSWLPTAAVMVYIVTYCLGFATVPFTMIGELFPKNMKAVAAALYIMLNSAVQFAVSKLFQVVSDNLGYDVTFLGFAVICYCFIPFIWILVPETKQQSFDDIISAMKSKN